ncbi:MAG: HEPN domain-containing protein [Rhodospirillales bacterium]|nr:HEPN domain-containing protein [Rhodospirillales bacterium]
MKVFELFSTRKHKAESAGETDVYQYDELPQKVRVQISKIWDDAIGRYWKPSGYSMGSTPYHNNDYWQEIHDIVAREKGVFHLGDNYDNAKKRCNSHLMNSDNIDDCMDIIEISFKVIDKIFGKWDEYERTNKSISLDPKEAVDELNYRLREAGVGYQYADGQIIRVDSQYVHSETVKPALALLSDPIFKGAEEEYRSAHTHYRSGENKDAIVDAANAFESTMKAICDAKGWDFEKGARASDLVKVLRKNGLFPDYLDKSFNQLLAVLQSGLPQVRNNEGSHGQGATPKEIPAHVAALALHLAAVKIVFLGDCFKVK